MVSSVCLDDPVLVIFCSLCFLLFVLCTRFGRMLTLTYYLYLLSEIGFNFIIFWHDIVFDVLYEVLTPCFFKIFFKFAYRFVGVCNYFIFVIGFW